MTISLMLQAEVVSTLEHGNHGRVVHSLSYHPTKAAMLSAVRGTMLLWTALDKPS